MKDLNTNPFFFIYPAAYRVASKIGSSIEPSFISSLFYWIPYHVLQQFLLAPGR